MSIRECVRAHMCVRGWKSLLCRFFLLDHPDKSTCVLTIQFRPRLQGYDYSVGSAKPLCVCRCKVEREGYALRWLVKTRPRLVHLPGARAFLSYKRHRCWNHQTKSHQEPVPRAACRTERWGGVVHVGCAGNKAQAATSPQLACSQLTRHDERQGAHVQHHRVPLESGQWRRGCRRLMP